MATLETMYPLSVGNRATTLTAQYRAGTDTSITVASSVVLPAAPNYACVWHKVSDDEQYIITIKYTGLAGNTLSGVTVVEYDASSSATHTYPIGCAVYRPLTKADVDAIKGNISAINAAIPAKVSDLPNDVGYQNETQVQSAISTHNTATTAHADLLEAKLNANAGIMHAGQMLVVGTDGTIGYTNVPQGAIWGFIDGNLSNQTDLNNALAEKLDVQYTATSDGYIAKVDPADHKLKVMAASTSTVKFADIDGDPSDNTKLRGELNAKINTANIINTHDSTATDKPLSANQGKIIYAAVAAHADLHNNPHATTMSNLGDVDVSLVSDGKTLRYNSATSKWEVVKLISDSETATSETVWSSLYTKSKIDALSGQVPVAVVATQPTSPRENTLYFIGASAPYTIKLYGLNEETETYQWYEMGTTSIDLTGYLKQTDVVDNLTSADTDKPLSAKQGKVLQENKATIYYSSSEPAGIQAGDYWASPDAADSTLEQTIYDVIYPVGKVVLQYTSTDNPNDLKPTTVTATWEDITSSMDNRYFRANAYNPAGFKQMEQLPNIKGKIDSKWIPNYGGSGALIATSTSGGCYGTTTGDIGYGISFDANKSCNIYMDNAPVQPLTTTVKVWRRTA